MKKLFLAVPLFLLLFVPISKLTLAAPENNPIFATVQYVDQKFEELLASFNLHKQQNQTDFDFINQRADGLEERVEYLESLLTPTPTPVDCPDGQEMTFANWYVPVGGVITANFDAQCFDEVEFYWSCNSEIHLEYSNDQSDWTSQLDITREQCEATGMQGLDVIGKYYRVNIGPTDLSSHFVFAQGRFSRI